MNGLTAAGGGGAPPGVGIETKEGVAQGRVRGGVRVRVRVNPPNPYPRALLRGGFTVGTSPNTSG